MKTPEDTYPQAAYGSGAKMVKGRRFRATGEYRPPLKGEWYLLGAAREAYYSPNAGLTAPVYIAVPIMPWDQKICPTCGQEIKSHGDKS